MLNFYESCSEIVCQVKNSTELKDFGNPRKKVDVENREDQRKLFIKCCILGETK